MGNRIRSLAAAAILGVGASLAQAGPLLYLSTGSAQLGTVDAVTGAVSLIGNTAVGGSNVVMTDIAFDPSGQLWGISFGDLYSIDKATGASTLVGGLGSFSGTANGLVFGADGTLYMAGSTLYTVDTGTGASTAIGSGIGHQSGGDLAFVGGRLLMSTSADNLVEIDLLTGAGTLLGAIGIGSVFGMATPDNVTLYGLAGDDVIQIDSNTGVGTVLTTFNPAGLLTGGAFGSAFFEEAGAGVPVPATYGLVVLGLFAAAATRRRRA